MKKIRDNKKFEWPTNNIENIIYKEGVVSKDILNILDFLDFLDLLKEKILIVNNSDHKDLLSKGQEIIDIYTTLEPYITKNLEKIDILSQQDSIYIQDLNTFIPQIIESGEWNEQTLKIGINLINQVFLIIQNSSKILERYSMVNREIPVSRLYIQGPRQIPLIENQQIHNIEGDSFFYFDEQQDIQEIKFVESIHNKIKSFYKVEMETKNNLSCHQFLYYISDNPFIARVDKGEYDTLSDVAQKKDISQIQQGTMLGLATNGWIDHSVMYIEKKDNKHYVLSKIGDEGTILVTSLSSLQQVYGDYTIYQYHQ